MVSNCSVIVDALNALNNTVSNFADNGTFEKYDAAFEVQVFSTDEILLDLSYVPPNLTSALTSGVLDENTVFRVGSVSKLVTVYALLAEVGMKYLNDPVTKWIPELVAVAANGNKSRTETVLWAEVTIGALAGQLSGMSRDYALGDFSTIYSLLPEGTAEQYALKPPLREDTPTCGTAGLPPCSRNEFFRAITKLHPVTSAFQTPIYSNIAFQVLAYAIEGMTNKTFNESLTSSLLEPLGMTRTSLEHPLNKNNTIIPENETISWWDTITGDASSYGGIFSTAADMRKLGQSILNSSLLPPATTRAWLKPISHTADLKFAVGMPWEIQRVLLPLSPTSSSTRVVDLYTKNGLLGLYSAVLVLSPDHNMGIVGLFAGTGGGESLMVQLTNLLIDSLLPAFEEAARQQAIANIAGTYANAETGMSMTLVVEEGLPGLAVQNWRMGSLDVIKKYSAISGIPETETSTLRLHPTIWDSGDKMRFTGIYRLVSNITTALPLRTYLGGCTAWAGVGSPLYGGIGFDDFEVVLGSDGRAKEITPRVARQTLVRVQ